MSDNPDLPTPGLNLGEAPPRVSPGIERFFAAMAMALVTLITFANVVVRYLTNFSFAFTEEYSVFLMVVMAFFGASAAFASDRHIRMTFFTERLPRRIARRIEYVLLAIAILLFAQLVWYGAKYTYDIWRFEETSAGLGVPVWIYWVWLPLMSAVIVLRLIGRVIRVARAA
jgi:TRAP-type transport system small permease protein